MPENYLLQMSLLYVEDDSETRDELKTFLNRRVGKVITAKDGVDGIEKFEEHHPDIVIVDILMPRLDGIEMMRELRSRDYDAHFIITSTKNESNTIIETVDLGIDKYIIKPVKLDELEKCLLQIAKEHRQQNFNLESLGFDEKKRLEFNIRKELSNYLKSTSGKGPRDISIFIHEDKIDVIAYSTLTPMEQIILHNTESKTLVKNNRNVFYEAISQELEDIIASLINIPVHLQKIEINLPKNDTLVFEL